MRFIIFFLILAIFITAIYFYTKNEDEIIEIKTNLNDYRIIPKDKGGVDTPDLNIYDLGD